MNSHGPRSAISAVARPLGDFVTKCVDFEVKAKLCQFIKDSPPKSFRKETTEIELNVNETIPY